MQYASILISFFFILKNLFIISLKRYQPEIVANDEAKEAHRQDFEKAKEEGEVDGDYEPLNTLFDLAVRWLQMFLKEHKFDIPTFLRWLHHFWTLRATTFILH